MCRSLQDPGSSYAPPPGAIPAAVTVGVLSDPAAEPDAFLLAMLPPTPPPTSSNYDDCK